MAMFKAQTRSLCIGVGGTGGQWLKQVKAYFDRDDQDVRFLAIDTDRGARGDLELCEFFQLHTDFVKPALSRDALRRERIPMLKRVGVHDGGRWIENLRASLRNAASGAQDGVGRVRPNGLMSLELTPELPGVIRNLLSNLQNIANDAADGANARPHGDNNDNQVTVHIAASVAGGTGSSIAASVAAMVHKIGNPNADHPTVKIRVYLFLPSFADELYPNGNDVQRDLAYANAYAALEEWNWILHGCSTQETGLLFGTGVDEAACNEDIINVQPFLIDARTLAEASVTYTQALAATSLFVASAVGTPLGSMLNSAEANLIAGIRNDGENTYRVDTTAVHGGFEKRYRSCNAMMLTLPKDLLCKYLSSKVLVQCCQSILGADTNGVTASLELLSLPDRDIFGAAVHTARQQFSINTHINQEAGTFCRGVQASARQGVQHTEAFNKSIRQSLDQYQAAKTSITTTLGTLDTLQKKWFFLKKIEEQFEKKTLKSLQDAIEQAKASHTSTVNARNKAGESVDDFWGKKKKRIAYVERVFTTLPCDFYVHLLEAHLKELSKLQDFVHLEIASIEKKIDRVKGIQAEYQETANNALDEIRRQSTSNIEIPLFGEDEFQKKEKQLGDARLILTWITELMREGEKILSDPEKIKTSWSQSIKNSVAGWLRGLTIESYLSDCLTEGGEDTRMLFANNVLGGNLRVCSPLWSIRATDQDELSRIFLFGTRNNLGDGIHNVAKNVGVTGFYPPLQEAEQNQPQPAGVLNDDKMPSNRIILLCEEFYGHPVYLNIFERMLCCAKRHEQHSPLHPLYCYNGDIVKACREYYEKRIGARQPAEAPQPKEVSTKDVAND